MHYEWETPFGIGNAGISGDEIKMYGSNSLMVVVGPKTKEIGKVKPSFLMKPSCGL